MKNTLITVCLSFTLAFSMTHGQTSGVESFDYTAGTVLTNYGAEADAGFDGPWYSADNIDIVSGSIDPGSYPVLPTSGNRVFWNADRGFRNLDKVYSGENDETLYISFLRKESAYFDMVYAAFELFNGGTNDKVDRVFAIGALQNDSAGVDGIAYYERISARMNNVQDTVDYLGDRDQTNPVEFYVMKIELVAAGADTVSIWRNPSSSDLGEPTAVITDLPEYPLVFDRIALSTWDHPDGLGFKTDMDEIRMGPTLGDVMQVEASSGWYGYTVNAQGWADTGGWLSMLEVTNDPWVWSLGLRNYIYVGDDSGWIYIPR